MNDRNTELKQRKSGQADLLNGPLFKRIAWILPALPVNRTFEMIMVVYPLSRVLTGTPVICAYFRVRKKLMPQKA